MRSRVPVPVLALTLLLSTTVSAVAVSPELFHRGVGVPSPYPPANPNAMWSEPPDLNGLIGSSEEILQFGLTTEIANDFVPSEQVLTRVTFWGGYYNNDTPCDPGIPTPGFNLEFFQDNDCAPGILIANILAMDFTEESVGCQGGWYPMYKWSAAVRLPLTVGTRYWFCGQLRDHAFPPQGGRLESHYVRDCPAMFRSAYFSYPDWEWTCSDIFEVCDFSQEFEGMSTDPAGACCVSAQSCQILLEGQCAAAGGEWHGSGTLCGIHTCSPGACCRADGSCELTTQFRCTGDAIWQGFGSNCLSAVCEPRAPGSIAAWGQSVYGQCNVPSPNARFTAVAVGDVHALGLRQDGTVTAWGSNNYGQCDVPDLHRVKAIAAGVWHSLALEPDGSIVAWGRNDYGQCAVPPDTGFVAVAGGSWHGMALTRGGQIVTWGDDFRGQCDVPEPNADFIAIGAGYAHSVGLKSDGTIVAWGWNDYWQCRVPQPNRDFVAIAVSGNTGLGLKQDGSVVAWGDCWDGQCQVPSPNAGFATIAIGPHQCAGLKTDGSIVVWGSNIYGQCHVPRPNRDFAGVATGGYGGVSFGITRPATVACCMRDGSCAMATPDECAAGGGVSLGSDVSCDAGACRGGAAGAGSVFVDDGRAALVRPSPNPGAGSILVTYELRSAAGVEVTIHDAAGRVVRRFTPGLLPAGSHSLTWDCRDDNGRTLPSGIYLARVAAGGRITTGRLVVVGKGDR